MENHLKIPISRMFRSSFGSCRAQNELDVIEKAVGSPKYPRGCPRVEPQALPSSSFPKVRPFPSMCRPQTTSETIRGSFIKSVPKDSLSRKQVSKMSPASKWEGLDGRTCPPPSPTSPLNLFSHCKQLGFIEEAKNKTSPANARVHHERKKKKASRMRTKSLDFFPFSSSPMYSSLWWYSSDDGDDENEVDTLFSSKSRSSSSSNSGRKKHKSHRERRGNKSFEMDILPLSRKLKDSYAVVKKSSDPYNDFRASMVEMIIERQIFSPSDLQNLLLRFLWRGLMKNQSSTYIRICLWCFNQGGIVRGFMDNQVPH